MADSKITDLSALTGANTADGDLFELVDVSDTTLAATGTNKKQTAAELANAVKARMSIDTIASGSLPAAATLDITSISAKYSSLHLKITGASSNTATRHPRVQVDSDNGASFDTTAGNYPGLTMDTATGGILASAEASLCPRIVDAVAAGTFDIDIVIWGYNGGPHMQFQFAQNSALVGFGAYIGTTNAINALRILWNGTGNFDAGTYALYGMY